MNSVDQPVSSGVDEADGAASNALIDAADVPGGAGSSSTGPRASLPDPDDATERRALLELLIYAWDRARSPGVWERLTTGLAAVGVSVERPDGAPFDPARHEVGGVQTTEDAALVDTVAETELVGFTDRGTVIREPIVVVYRRS